MGTSDFASPIANPRRIDVHHHFTPPAYLEFQRVHNQGAGVGRGGGRGRAGANQFGSLGSAYPGWTFAEDLEDMDRSGTAAAVLGETQEVRKIVRECNEHAAESARGLTTNKIFTEEELRAINRGNVERILPKYRA